MPSNLPGMIRIFIFFIPLLFISAQGTNNNINSSLQDPIVRFGLVSDVQYCECEASANRYYKQSINKLREAVNDLNREELNFIISLGDLIEMDSESFSDIMPVLDSARAKVYHVLGNHDFNVEPKEKKNIFSRMETGPGYYSFDIESFRFIVVNSNDISTYSPFRSNIKIAEQLIRDIYTEGGVNSFEWNGGIGRKQLDWLKDELSEAKRLNMKVIVFSHHPVWPESIHNILNYKEILSILDNYDHIIAWFCGHNHQGGYGNYNHVHCVNFKGMVDTPDLNAYSVVEIYENKIWIKGRGREKSQILAY